MGKLHFANNTDLTIFPSAPQTFFLSVVTSKVKSQSKMNNELKEVHDAGSLQSNQQDNADAAPCQRSMRSLIASLCNSVRW